MTCHLLSAPFALATKLRMITPHPHVVPGCRQCPSFGNRAESISSMFRSPATQASCSERDSLPRRRIGRGGVHPRCRVHFGARRQSARTSPATVNANDTDPCHILSSHRCAGTSPDEGGAFGPRPASSLAPGIKVVHL